MIVGVGSGRLLLLDELALSPDKLACNPINSRGNGYLLSFSSCEEVVHTCDLSLSVGQ